MLGVSVLGLDDFDQFDLVELVDANHAARADAGRPGFAAKTRSVSTVINRELALLEDFFTMNIGDGRFRGRDEIEFAPRARIQTFLDAVVLVGKFGKLPDAF